MLQFNASDFKKISESHVDNLLTICNKTFDTIVLVIFNKNNKI